MTDDGPHYCDGKAASGYVTVPSWLIALVGDPNSKITGDHLTVFVVIKTWYGPTSLRPWPKIKSIMARSGLGRSKVYKVLIELEKVGAIRRGSRGKEGGGRSSNSYELATPEGPLPRDESVTDDNFGDQTSTDETPNVHEPAPLTVHEPARLNVHEPAQELDKAFELDKEFELDTRELDRESVLHPSDAEISESITEPHVRHAVKRLEQTMRENFPDQPLEARRYRIGNVIDIFRPYPSEEEEDETDLALAVGAVADRMEKRLERVDSGISDIPFRYPKVVEDIAKFVRDLWERQGDWPADGYRAMDNYWNEWVEEGAWRIGGVAS